MYPSIDCDTTRPTYKELRQHAKEMRLKRKEQLKWIPLWLQITLPLASILIFPLFVFVPLLFHYKNKYIREINQNINKLSNNEIELSVSDFLRMRNQTFGGQGSPQYVKDKQFPGVYILFNKTKNMYYVGQAQYIFDRVNAHFTGKGNGDVYADYKYGDEFTIKMISLKKSGYRSLNELERHTIMTYNAFSKGYNKTRGNF